MASVIPIFIKIAQSGSELFSHVSDQLRKLGLAASEAQKATATGGVAAEQAALGYTALAEALSQAGPKGVSFLALQDKLAAQISKTAGALISIADSMGSAELMFSANETAASDLAQKYLELTARMIEFAGQTRNITSESLKDLLTQLQMVTESVGTTAAKGLLDYADGATAGTESTQALVKALEKLNTIQGVIRETIVKMDALLESMTETGDTAAPASEAIGGVGKSLYDLTEAQQKAEHEARAFRIAYRPISSVFQGIMLGINAARGSLQGFLFSMIFAGFSVPKIAFPIAGLTAALVLLTKTLTGTTKAIIDFGRAGTTLMNKLRPFLRTTREMGQAFDYATAASVKFGREADDVSEAMRTLARAGLGDQKTLEAVAVAAVANSMKIDEAASIFVAAIGEEQENLEALHELGVHVNEALVDKTNRASVAQAAQAAILKQLDGAYRDVAMSSEQSLSRISNGLKAIFSYLIVPIWEKFFTPALFYLAEFVAKLVSFARALWHTDEVQQHLQGTIKLFQDTIKEFTPELKLLGNIIKAGILVALKVILVLVRGLVVLFRFFLQVVRALTAAFQRLGSLLKPLRELLATLFPKDLGTSIHIQYRTIKEGILNIWEAAKKEWEDIKKTIADFFENNPIGIYLKILWELASDIFSSLWNRLKSWWTDRVIPWLQDRGLFSPILAALTISIGTFKLLGLNWSMIWGAIAGAIIKAPGMIFRFVGRTLQAFLVGQAFLTITDFVISTMLPQSISDEWNRWKKETLDPWLAANPIKATVGVTIAGLVIMKVVPAVIKAAVSSIGKLIGAGGAKTIGAAIVGMLGTVVKSGAVIAAAKAIGIAIVSAIVLGAVSSLIIGSEGMKRVYSMLLEKGAGAAWEQFKDEFSSRWVSFWNDVGNLISSIKLPKITMPEISVSNINIPPIIPKILLPDFSKVSEAFALIRDDVGPGVIDILSKIGGKALEFINNLASVTGIKTHFLTIIGVGKTVYEFFVTLAGFVGEHVVPIFKTLGEIIGKALEVVGSFFGLVRDIGIKVLQTLWELCKAFVLPVLEGLWEIFKQIAVFCYNVFAGAIKAIIDGFAAFWELIKLIAPYLWEGLVAQFNAVVDVLKVVWGWIKDNVIPIFTTLWDWLCKIAETVEKQIIKYFNEMAYIVSEEGPLGKAFKWFGENVLDPINERFKKLRDLLDKAREYLAKLREGIQNFDPSAFVGNLITPGHSPSPLEDSVRGIISAFNDLSSIKTPPVLESFSPTVGVGPAALAPAPVTVARQTPSIIVNVTVTGNYVLGQDGTSALADATANEIMRRISSKYPVSMVR